MICPMFTKILKITTPPPPHKKTPPKLLINFDDMIADIINNN